MRILSPATSPEAALASPVDDYLAVNVNPRLQSKLLLSRTRQAM